MNNNYAFQGTGKVYGFTLRQMLKNKSNIVSFVIMILLSLLAFPIMTLTGGASSISSEPITGIETVFVSNNSGYELDYQALKDSNAYLSGLNFEETGYTLEDYSGHIGLKDVYVLIGPMNTLSSCSIEAHILEGSTVMQVDLESITAALAGQAEQARYQELGISPQELSVLFANSAVSAYSQEEYTEGTDKMSFDGNFAIQYGYSILVLFLSVLSTSFIIRAIVEEKASKLIELLMVSVRPLALILGKILAVMTYVFAMLLSMAVGFAISYQATMQLIPSAASLTDTLTAMGIQLDLINIGWGTIIVVLISLFLSFATFSLLSGLVGTCCSSVEEVEPANTTVILIIMAGYLVSCIGAAVENPAAQIFFSLCPVISVFCAPTLYVCGSIMLPVLLISWLIQLIILVALALFTSRVYQDLLLYKGNRLKLRQVFTMFKNNRKEAAKA